MYTCKICGKIFEIRQSMAAHVCSAHTDRNKIETVDAEKHCLHCGTVFTVKRHILKGVPKPYSYERVYCRKCANSRVQTPAANIMRSNKLKGRVKCEYVEKICPLCDSHFSVKPSYRKQIFCSKQCKITAMAQHRKDTCTLEIRRKLSAAGRRSVLSQNRRSKNEIYFADLCKTKFNNIECNKPIFNGWDADVIIHDIKIAVLWNGPWHYRQIHKKHSVAMVQNRDRIKQKEIIKYGYTPYTIKDMGKYRKAFVETAFNNFIAEYGSSNQ